MKKSFSATLQPSILMSTMGRHGRPSASDKPTELARRVIIGHEVVFLSNGEHYLSDSDLDAAEQYHSEVLRLAHASLITGQPEGDKRICWVDANKNPVDVWIYNQPIAAFVREALATLQSEVIIDGNPVQTLRNRS
jgi:hypothetical protein